MGYCNDLMKILASMPFKNLGSVFDVTFLSTFNFTQWCVLDTQWCVFWHHFHFKQYQVLYLCPWQTLSNRYSMCGFNIHVDVLSTYRDPHVSSLFLNVRKSECAEWHIWLVILNLVVCKNISRWNSANGVSASCFARVLFLRPLWQIINRRASPAPRTAVGGRALRAWLPR